ncbi:hypothetical protein LSTR_LSTR005533 [Laodelphax striatellus]|uniref:Protein kinase domain-containing protein n=1 Tax=Laodelphax striatellus TaxID=195883 RepID=A0A482WXX9_LAOST|nr:hypothetical protein LSTR_LSTR005533 [Laodelphax striatellus]
MKSTIIPATVLFVLLLSTDILELCVRAVTYKPDCLLFRAEQFTNTSQRPPTLEEVRLRCEGSLQNICFWHTFKEKVIKIKEGDEGKLVIPLGSPDLCQRDLIYTLKNGSSYLNLVSSEVCGLTTWSLHGNTPFDRELLEVIGPFTVECTDGVETVNMTLSVGVDDINDNPPTLPSEAAEAGAEHPLLDKSLLAVDRDSPPVNGYRLVSELLAGLGGYGYTLTVSKRSIRLQSGITGTGLYCDIEVNDTSSVLSPLSGTVRIVDTTFQSTSQPDFIDVPVRIYFDEERNSVVCERLLTSKKKVKRSHIDERSYEVVYPPVVRLSLNATPLTRLAEPNNFASLGGYEFKLNNYYRRNFNVTKAFGIVYLNNTIGLDKYSNIILNISWIEPRLGYNGSTTIKVNISSVGMSSCKGDHNNINAWLTCAENGNEKKCIQSCGLGTGNFLDNSGNNTVGCHWRTPSHTNTTFNRIPFKKLGYYTCVANPRTCPDNWCDPYEALNIRLCPQDCTKSKFIFGVVNSSNKDELGIGWTVGLCICDSYGKCTCESMNTSASQKKSNVTSVTTYQKTSKKKFTTSTTTIVATSSPVYQITDDHLFAGYHMCGSACLSAVMTVSIILSAIITLVVCKCVGESARRKMKPTSTNSNIRSTDTLITLEPIASPANDSPVDSNSALLIDPEWEFPREKVKIDFCLGEGEFGRVLKAQATNIAGIPGVTTVAVKTLKDGAGEAELADLLSEYQMLKELSHPNVIRLLGASTVPGGPVYLIMEFASHGSLKSYLRRHRPLETSNNPEVAARIVNEHSVTPKDILSFAWQIAKGMAYLSDMKLVHRDLAARNVLVATGKVCKISDFGLTRDIYVDETYLKRSKGKVPVKWMALESLSDQIYTIKSDVWGFGVLLWELVTMGSSPYPGIAVQNLFFFLKSGYRMEKPRNCSHQLYEIMRSCWYENPSQRPTFHQLTQSLERMLEDGTDYLELDSWFASNRLYFSDLLQKDTTLDSGNSSDTDNANNNFEGVAETEHTDKILNDKTNFKETESANIVAHYANDGVTLNTYKNFPNDEMYAKMSNGYVNCKSNEV